MLRQGISTRGTFDKIKVHVIARGWWITAIRCYLRGLTPGPGEDFHFLAAISLGGLLFAFSPRFFGDLYSAIINTLRFLNDAALVIRASALAQSFHLFKIGFHPKMQRGREVSSPIKPTADRAIYLTCPIYLSLWIFDASSDGSLRGERPPSRARERIWIWIWIWIAIARRQEGKLGSTTREA